LDGNSAFVGTVGGLTNLHPLVKIAFQILEIKCRGLMQLMAATGLAQNYFGTLRSLTTTGIQERSYEKYTYCV
jgi:hydroxymethylglutaryl-CoA reductase